VWQVLHLSGEKQVIGVHENERFLFNFAKCSQISKILSPATSVVNL